MVVPTAKNLIFLSMPIDADADAVTPSSNTRSYTLWSVPSSPGVPQRFSSVEQIFLFLWRLFNVILLFIQEVFLGRNLLIFPSFWRCFFFSLGIVLAHHLWLLLNHFQHEFSFFRIFWTSLLDLNLPPQKGSKRQFLVFWRIYGTNFRKIQPSSFYMGFVQF